MPRVDLKLAVEVERTPRVAQIEGIFDMPEAKRSEVEFHFDVPLDAQPWQVGLIVGPSGAGKTSVARHLFGDAMVAGYEWHPARAVVDGFTGPDGAPLPVHEVQRALSSVGFSSPPSWIRPFRVLSNGEQFRATMARALVDPRPLICIDEFTSVVDRTVARIGAAAFSKAVRRDPGKQFVAVTCHEDVAEWLQPDWILEPQVGRFTWRLLQRRPPIALEIVRAEYSAWRWFSHHHYMSAELHRSVRCFVGMIDGKPVAFGSYLKMPHPDVKTFWSFNRVVVLPDYQGLGLGTGAFIDPVAAIGATLGHRVIVHPAHPGQIKALAKSPNWNMTSVPRFANRAGKTATAGSGHATRRRVAHFEYVGPKLSGEQAEQARRLWDG